MLQLAFPRNNKIIASYVTHSAKSKVTKSLKRSPIITSQVVIPDLKKRKKQIKDMSLVNPLMCTLIYEGVNTTYFPMLIIIYYIVLGIWTG